MPIEVLAHQVPQAITWFNTFVGFTELWTRLERVEEKLRSIDFASPVFARRFFFHANYKRLIIRNRTFQKIDLGLLENYQPISFVVAVRDAANNLSSKARKRLRGNILDAISPDRDLRALEHELRVYTHYRQQGCEVTFADLERRGDYDFEVRRGSTIFEVEAKTVNEDVGNLVSTDQSLAFFEAFKLSMGKALTFRESGILTYAVHTRGERRFDAQEIAATISDFLTSAAAEKHYDTAKVSFNRKLDWERYIREQNFSPVRTEILANQENMNPHAMIVLGHGQAVMFCVVGNRPIRLFKGICERLKAASSQLTGRKPGLIWMHFLGLDENEFSSLRAEAMSGKRSVFNSLANYTFDSDRRRHICRLRFSADSDQVRSNTLPLLTVRPQRTISQQGPTYEMISNVSKFDPHSFI